MQHNAEPEACDLLMEVNRLDKIVDYVDESNYVRVCLYLVCALLTLLRHSINFLSRLDAPNMYQIHKTQKSSAFVLLFTSKLTNTPTRFALQSALVMQN
jgi:hypothetical protein